MKKIYAFEALIFGLRGFLKNPVFFIFTFILGKIILICGLFLAMLASFPFFINLIELGTKIFAQSKDFLQHASFKRAIAVVKQFIAAFTDIKAILTEVIESKFLFLFFLIGVIVFLFFIKIFYDYVILGWTKLSLDYYDKKPKSIELFFNRPIIWLKYIIATTLFLLVLTIPSLVYLWGYLLTTYFTPVQDKTAYIFYSTSIIISIYFALRLWFYPYFILDENISALDALRKSYNLKYGFLNILLLFILYSLLLMPTIYYLIYYPSTLTYSIFGIYTGIIWMSSWKSYAFIYKKLNAQN